MWESALPFGASRAVDTVPHSCSNGGDEAIRTSRRNGRRSSRELKLRQMRESWDGQPEMGGWAAYIEHNALAMNRFNGLYDSQAKRRKTPIRTVLGENWKPQGIREQSLIIRALVAW